MEQNTFSKVGLLSWYLFGRSLRETNFIKIMKVKISVSNSLWSHGLYNPWNSPGQKTEVDSLSLLQGIFPTPGIQPRSPPLQVDSLPAEPQGKPKNTWVGRPSLLQWIFSTQESNWGLLHCRHILYQLRYQGMKMIFIMPKKTHQFSLLKM